MRFEDWKLIAPAGSSWIARKSSRLACACEGRDSRAKAIASTVGGVAFRLFPACE
jgi:hypothetical protein